MGKAMRADGKLAAAAVVAGLIVGPASAEATVYPYAQATSSSRGVVTNTAANGRIPFSVETGRKVH
jgi:hypothetical protein